jgi:hypothetical protein
MARSGDGGPPWIVPMIVASQPSPMGERLRPLNLSVIDEDLYTGSTMTQPTIQMISEDHYVLPKA